MTREFKDVFNYHIIKDLLFVGDYELPLISKVDVKPNEIISFNYVNSFLKKKQVDPKDYFVHFFIDDYQFERVWNNPNRYFDQLIKFKGIIMPDFSVYRNFPKALQVFQVFKSRVIAAYYTQRGMTVIPTLAWSDEASLEWILDGLPKESVLALSSNGCLNKATVNEFIRIYKIAVEKLKPTNVVFVGKVTDELKNDEEIIAFDSHLQIMKGGI